MARLAWYTRCMGVLAAFVDQLRTTGLRFSGVETTWATEVAGIRDAGDGLSLVQFLPFGEFTANAQGFRVGTESIPAITQVAAVIGDALIDYEHNSERSYDGIEFSSRAAGWLKAIHVAESSEQPADARFSGVSSPGVWGVVALTEQARSMIKSGEYRFFSPVFLHDDDGLVLGIVGGGLTNTPAIKHMRPLAAKQKNKGDTPMSETDWSKIAADVGLESPGAIGDAAQFQAAMKARQDAAVAAAEKAASERVEAAELEARMVRAKQLITAGLASGALPDGTGDFWAEQAKTAAGMATLEGMLAAAKPRLAPPTPPTPGIESKPPGGADVPATPDAIMANEPPPGVRFQPGSLERAQAALAHAKTLRGTPGHKRAVLEAYKRIEV